MGVNSIVTAESARRLKGSAEKLINCILRQIKEAAEYGQTQVNLSFTNLSDAACKAVDKTLKDLGFDVAITIPPQQEVGDTRSVNYEIVVKW